jgi:hypothetical protein
MQKYDKAVFRRLANISGYEQETLSQYVRVEDGGVYPSETLDILAPSWRWKPRHALVGQTGNTSAGPSLAFDFTAADLAAFLLTHSAVFLTEVWGNIEEGPRGLLEPDDYGDAADAAILLAQAYQLLQNTLAQVGPRPFQEELDAVEADEVFMNARDTAIDEYKVGESGVSNEENRQRHAVATSEVADLKKRRDELRALAELRLKQWRRAMTRHLLMGEAAQVLTNHSIAESIKKQWSLKKDFRPRDFSYIGALRQTMQVLIEQNVKPTASAVLAFWKSQKPEPIRQVADQYFVLKGVNNADKKVMRKNLQNAIDRHLVCHSVD